MAKGDGRPNPFGWVVLGFLCGVAATIAALILLSGGLDDYTSQDQLDVEAASEAPPPQESAPPTPAAPPVVETIAPETAPPPADPPVAIDPQVAEDAAASGMTARRR